ncbi:MULTISPECIES: MarR family winged helix-turn-helix transcriptional regulator [Streptomyces]|uniref:MarR family winged helix-turn-helix transcriptional regulator n=1 Tax=Streptomyces TaxID=1883 RepID=UPI0004BE0E87|nr:MULTISPECIES: MarR family winged helix-turn-helix transcriptional regulator [unclassified Streptomyces]KOV73314.1 MarR family transcriptional regulator [Streptomyces sp. NRRL WC-3723]MBG7697180.1 winged helix-turn-helix transcriptional regulator [Streptomyces sp. MC1]
MTSTPPDLAEQCNNLALRKAARYLGATYDKALAPVGLRATQFSILQKLAAHGETTITALADMIAMDRTTMASNLKPLAREGLVTVETSPNDRRARIAAITPDGRARMREAVPLWKDVQARFEEAFGAEDADRLRTSLAAVLGTGFTPWAE